MAATPGKTYTLTEAAEALGADMKTLRRWVEIEKWDLTKQTTKYDERVKYLSEEQVMHLAKMHTRMWPPRQKPAGDQPGAPGKLHILEEKVAALEENHIDGEKLDDWMQDAARRIQELESKYTRLLVQNSDLILALKELQDWKASQESKPKPGRKPKAQGEGEAAQGD
jgi:uncharacterized protein YjcR